MFSQDKWSNPLITFMASPGLAVAGPCPSAPELGASLQLTRAEQRGRTPSLPCCPHGFGRSPGHSWIAGQPVHRAGAPSASHGPTPQALLLQDAGNPFSARLSCARVCLWPSPAPALTPSSALQQEMGEEAGWKANVSLQWRPQGSAKSDNLAFCSFSLQILTMWEIFIPPCTEIYEKKKGNVSS